MDQREREDAARHERWLKALEKAEHQRDALAAALAVIRDMQPAISAERTICDTALAAAGRKAA